MDFRRLRYFTRVVELGSISQAAADLHVAQPALSKSILGLEAELKTRLLDRSPHGVTVTEPGRRLYEHCLVVFSQLERARSEVAEVTRVPSGQVAVGMPASVANVLMMPLLRAASDKLPKVRLQVFQEPRQSLPDRILSGRIDFGLIVYPSNLTGLQQRPLVTEQLVFVCHIGEKLGPEPVSPAAISKIPLILPTRENRLRVFVESLFLAHALALDVRYEVDAIGHYVDCVEAGLASTILPASSIMPFRGKRCIAICQISDPSFRRTITFASSQARPLGLAATHTATLLNELIKNKIQNGDWPGASLGSV